MPASWAARPAWCGGARAAQRPVDALDGTALRTALTVHARRRVRKDSTLDCDGKVWELAAGFLTGHVVDVYRSLVEPDGAPWGEYEGKRLPRHPGAPVRNARRKRARRPAPPRRTMPFDRPGALPDRAVGREPCHAKEKHPPLGRTSLGSSRGGSTRAGTPCFARWRRIIW
jgi:hypothetical protein